FGQRVEHLNGPRHRPHLASGWPTGASHSRVLCNGYGVAVMDITSASASARKGAVSMSVQQVRFLVVGAGIQGLARAWQLARRLRAAGRGDGSDVLVIDKSAIGAGASGVACGVIRNNYFQPAMRELMAHSVGVWESDPEAFSYHPVGYLQAAP